MRAVAVATSGGRDSTALLHSTLKAAAGLGIEVVALHVHHGLQAQADDWLAHVGSQARRWGAVFDSRRIASQPEAGESVEAWARRLRYAALTEMAVAAGCGLVLLAHHRRDQAETWLLQALRGGGPLGLAAMPGQVERQSVVWCRPWLNQPREAIDSYVRRHRLRFVEDPSNADPRHPRNRLRSAVWPALLTAFPQAESALTTAAEHAHAAALLADEVLQQDLPALLDERGGLRTGLWLGLPPARRRNVLQGWLRQALGRGAPESLVARLYEELPRCRASTWPAPGASLRLYRGVLRAGAVDLRALSPVLPQTDKAAAATPNLSVPGVHPLPAWGGSCLVEEAQSEGIPAPLLRDARLAPRVGGERFSLAVGAVPRSLKKQFQTCGIPNWQRKGPLVFSAEGWLIWVPGLGIDARLWAAAGQPQLRLTWLPDPAAATGPRQRAG